VEEDKARLRTDSFAVRTVDPNSDFAGWTQKAGIEDTFEIAGCVAIHGGRCGIRGAYGEMVAGVKRCCPGSGCSVNQGTTLRVKGHLRSPKFGVGNDNASPMWVMHVECPSSVNAIC
jgi:hypothetical protein